jgi:hypothetical protein
LLSGGLLAAQAPQVAGWGADPLSVVAVLSVVPEPQAASQVGPRLSAEGSVADLEEVWEPWADPAPWVVRWAADPVSVAPDSVAVGPQGTVDLSADLSPREEG